MARKNKKPEKDTSERWLLTYSDLMNLLLILFIIFFSMSQINQAKAQKVAQSVQEGFGNTQASDAAGQGGGTGAGTAFPSEASASPSASGAGSGGDETAAYQAFYNDVLSLIKQYGLESSVEITLDQSGVVISFKDTVLFPSGSADLNDKVVALLDTIGDMLKSLKYSFVLVEGHTDSDPIHTAQYKDNVALSFARAGNVWDELVSRGLDPAQMASVGYGETRPVAPNDTPENKSKNRRVVITVFRAESDVKQHIASGAPKNTAGGEQTAASPS